MICGVCNLGLGGSGDAVDQMMKPSSCVVVVDGAAPILQRSPM